MPHQIAEGIAVISDIKSYPEPQAKRDMSEEPNDEQAYLRARSRFPKLSFSNYCRNRCLFTDINIQRALPNKDAVRKHLDNNSRLLYEGYYEMTQEAPIRQGLRELIEKDLLVGKLKTSSSATSAIT
jgi:hypothetical protein